MSFSSRTSCNIISGSFRIFSHLEDGEAAPQELPLSGVDGVLHLRVPPLQEGQEQGEEGRPRRVVGLGPQPERERIVHRNGF